MVNLSDLIHVAFVVRFYRRSGMNVNLRVIFSLLIISKVRDW